MTLRGLPQHFPEYLSSLPRLQADVNERNKNEKIDSCGLEQLVKLKLRNADPNFNLPTELRELSWRQRPGF